jgi:hypothetical protein
MIATAAPLEPDPNAVFAKSFLPEIERRSRQHYARFDPDARAEAVQESTCLAWKMFMSAHARGRIDMDGNTAQEGLPPITACSLAWFANRSYDSGRRFCGQNRTDALSDGTRIAGRVEVTSLECGDVLQEALTDHRAGTDPAPTVQARLDWSAFGQCGLLNHKSKAALPLLAAGYRNGQLAEALGVSDARSCQIKGLIGKAATKFFGSDVRPVVRQRGIRARGRRARRRHRSRGPRPGARREAS